MIFPFILIYVFFYFARLQCPGQSGCVGTWQSTPVPKECGQNVDSSGGYVRCMLLTSLLTKYTEVNQCHGEFWTYWNEIKILRPITVNILTKHAWNLNIGAISMIRMYWNTVLETRSTCTSTCTSGWFLCLEKYHKIFRLTTSRNRAFAK